MPASFPTPGFPARIVEVEEAASTNALALRLAADGERGPVWIAAKRQTAGRGRSGRAWVSLPGNLHATLLLTPGCAIAEAAQLSLVAGVAAFDAVRRAAAGQGLSRLRVKWPNDILVADAKLGGVLIESVVAPAGGLAVAVGVGLNLAASPEDPGRRATHLAAQGISISPETMLALLAHEMAEWSGHWNEGRGFPLIRSAWLERAGPVGERMSVNAGKGPVEGRFRGLDGSGALIVADDTGTEIRFTFGDVTILDHDGGMPPQTTRGAGWRGKATDV